jgi:hypothetical protein
MDQPSAPLPIVAEQKLAASRLLLSAAWLVVGLMLGFYTLHIAKVGIDLRNDFWVYWQNNRFYGDVNSAFRHGQHVLSEADDLAAQDPPNPGGLTIDQPGPGLFDSPLTFSTFRHRWHDLRPVYGQIFHGWIATYDNLVRDVSPDDYQMDYPPLRSLVMTLWAWKVKAQFPNLNQFPQNADALITPGNATPEIVRPLLMCNMFFEAVSADLFSGVDLGGP